MGRSKPHLYILSEQQFLVTVSISDCSSLSSHLSSDHPQGLTSVRSSKSSQLPHCSPRTTHHHDRRPSSRLRNLLVPSPINHMHQPSLPCHHHIKSLQSRPHGRSAHLSRLHSINSSRLFLSRKNTRNVQDHVDGAG